MSVYIFFSLKNEDVFAVRQVQRSFCCWVISLWPGFQIGLKLEPWLPSLGRIINFKLSDMEQFITKERVQEWAEQVASV